MTAARPSAKVRSMTLLALAQVLILSLWFVSSATLPAMLAEAAVSPARQAALASAVQAGFVLGALGSAVLGLPDRFDPRIMLAACAAIAAAANAILPAVEVGGDMAIAARLVTGVMLAGVYPVGMKIAAGWGTRDRGLLVAILVGALTLGSALPHAAALAGGTDWHFAVYVTSAAAAIGGAQMVFVDLGPHHARSPRFQPGAIMLAWTDRRIRRAYAGYLGHMWELYAMWAWLPVAASASFAMSMDVMQADRLAILNAFLSIALGGLACIWAGYAADRIGKAEVAILALAGSLAAGLATAASFGGPWWITFVLFVVWGITIIPDSAQFSALVADASPPQLAGSLMTFQTALGFALTFATVQLAPQFAAAFGWQAVLAALAIGPALGIVAMLPLRRTKAPGL